MAEVNPAGVHGRRAWATGLDGRELARALSRVHHSLEISRPTLVMSVRPWAR